MAFARAKHDSQLLELLGKLAVKSHRRLVPLRPPRTRQFVTHSRRLRVDDSKSPLPLEPLYRRIIEYVEALDWDLDPDHLAYLRKNERKAGYDLGDIRLAIRLVAALPKLKPVEDAGIGESQDELGTSSEMYYVLVRSLLRVRRPRAVKRRPDLTHASVLAQVEAERYVERHRLRRKEAIERRDLRARVAPPLRGSI